jgi:hypothetical protein
MLSRNPTFSTIVNQVLNLNKILDNININAIQASNININAIQASNIICEIYVGNHISVGVN